MVGVIVGAHGVRGAVRVKPFTAEPASVGAYGPVEDEAGTRRFALRVVGEGKGVVIATVKGVEDRNAAEALKGLRLYIARAALPAPAADEFYHADLIGLEAVTPTGERLGRVRAVHDFGAGDSLELDLDAGGTLLVPFTKAAVPEIELAAARLVVDPPEELMDTPPRQGGEADLVPSPARGRGREPTPSLGKVRALAEDGERRNSPHPDPLPQAGEGDGGRLPRKRGKRKRAR
jgi:16S rRNA processing protein RimM